MRFRATLPINQLKGKPPLAVCPILNVHRCKESKTFAKYNPSGTPIHQINCKDYDTVYVTSDIHADFRKFVQTMANNGLVALPKNGEATLDPYSENIYDLRLLRYIRVLVSKWIQKRGFPIFLSCINIFMHE